MNVSRVFIPLRPQKYLCVCPQTRTAAPWDGIQLWPSTYVPTYAAHVELSHRPRHSPTCEDERWTGNALKLLCQCSRLKDYPTVLNSATSCNVFSLRHSWKQRALVIWKGEISHHFTLSLRGQWDCDWYEKAPKWEVSDNLCSPFLGVFFIFSLSFTVKWMLVFYNKDPYTS